MNVSLCNMPHIRKLCFSLLQMSPPTHKNAVWSSSFQKTCVLVWNENYVAPELKHAHFQCLFIELPLSIHTIGMKYRKIRETFPGYGCCHLVLWHHLQPKPRPNIQKRNTHVIHLYTQSMNHRNVCIHIVAAWAA